MFPPPQKRWLSLPRVAREEVSAVGGATGSATLRDRLAVRPSQLLLRKHGRGEGFRPHRTEPRHRAQERAVRVLPAAVHGA